MKRIALLALLTLTGCDETWTEIESGTQGQKPNVNDELLVVRDTAAWSFLYYWVTNPEEIPAVDFNVDIVVGALLGNRPTSGYEVHFTDISWLDGVATVEVQETTPAPGTVVLQVVTKPWAFAVMTTATEVVGATELTFGDLVNEHFSFIPTPQNTVTPAADAALLEQGISPMGGTLVSAPLDVNLSGQDVSNDAWFDQDNGWYWVRHEQGAFVGFITQWYGPFYP